MLWLFGWLWTLLCYIACIPLFFLIVGILKGVASAIMPTSAEKDRFNDRKDTEELELLDPFDMRRKSFRSRSQNDGDHFNEEKELDDSGFFEDSFGDSSGLDNWLRRGDSRKDQISRNGERNKRSPRRVTTGFIVDRDSRNNYPHKRKNRVADFEWDPNGNDWDRRRRRKKENSEVVRRDLSRHSNMDYQKGGDSSVVSSEYDAGSEVDRPMSHLDDWMDDGDININDNRRSSSQEKQSALKAVLPVTSTHLNLNEQRDKDKFDEQASASYGKEHEDGHPNWNFQNEEMQSTETQHGDNKMLRLIIKNTWKNLRKDHSPTRDDKDDGSVEVAHSEMTESDVSFPSPIHSPMVRDSVSRFQNSSRYSKMNKRFSFDDVDVSVNQDFDSGRGESNGEGSPSTDGEDQSMPSDIFRYNEKRNESQMIQPVSSSLSFSKSNLEGKRNQDDKAAISTRYYRDDKRAERFTNQYVNENLENSKKNRFRCFCFGWMLCGILFMYYYRSGGLFILSTSTTTSSDRINDNDTNVNSVTTTPRFSTNSSLPFLSFRTTTKKSKSFPFPNDVWQGDILTLAFHVSNGIISFCTSFDVSSIDWNVFDLISYIHSKSLNGREPNQVVLRFLQRLEASSPFDIFGSTLTSESEKSESVFISMFSSLFWPPKLMGRIGLQILQWRWEVIVIGTLVFFFITNKAVRSRYRYTHYNGREESLRFMTKNELIHYISDQEVKIRNLSAQINRMGSDYSKEKYESQRGFYGRGGSLRHERLLLLEAVRQHKENKTTVKSSQKLQSPTTPKSDVPFGATVSSAKNSVHTNEKDGKMVEKGASSSGVIRRSPSTGSTSTNAKKKN
eukprot:g1052.t1